MKLGRLVHNLFSWRKNEASGTLSDVYVYDEIPSKLRTQIYHIIDETLAWDRINGRYDYHSAFGEIESALKHELGRLQLVTVNGYHQLSPREMVLNFLLREENVDDLLSTVEMAFRVIEKLERLECYSDGYRSYPNWGNDAIEALNLRLDQNRVGYFFQSGQLHRKDSEFLHANAVKPALEVLSGKRFAGPNQEFLKAHEFYRERQHKECLTWCLKAFESTMKVICDHQGWAYDKDKATVKPLLAILKEKGIVPSYLEQTFMALATIRNRFGGHGQGSEVKAVSPSLVTYEVNLTANAILFLVNAEKELR